VIQRRFAHKINHACQAEAPFLVVGIHYVASDGKLMQDQPSSMLSRIVVGITIVVMFGAAAGMFVL
jgi:hypothetical protein